MNVNCLIIIILSLLFNESNSFILDLTNFITKATNFEICQSDDIDSRTAQKNRKPYLTCADDAMIRISIASLGLSSEEECPLNFQGSNTPRTCDQPLLLTGTDATEILRDLCNGKSECFFNWNELPLLKCFGPPDMPQQEVDVDFNDQKLTVSFNCDPRRREFRSFTLGRYDRKRLPPGRQRKLSYNRLQQL